MGDRRPGAWLAGLVLGAISGLMVLELGSLGLTFVLVSLGLILWKGPRRLAGAGLVSGFGLILSVLFARVALTCGGPFDPGTSTCVAPDLTGWVIGGAVIFGLGLIASALALQRTKR